MLSITKKSKFEYSLLHVRICFLCKESIARDAFLVLLIFEFPGNQPRADVLELAEHLRHGIGGEMSESKVGRATATRLPRAADFELGAAGIGGLVPLKLIAPSFHEKALDEGSFRGRFLQDIATRPSAEAGEQRGGFGTCFKSIELSAPLGAEKGIFEER